ncbi:DEAD/DEAH box helicase [Roseibium sp.]|uniref:DEAD/DEAH box helicase n=1 Tax=Roseibium sp. TaxID=1936156 RepID=UPI003A987FCA
MTDFQNVVPALAKALEKKGYTTLTPVQTCVLDDAPHDADLLVSAQTGSGKTVAFGLALAPNLLGDDDKLPPPGAPLALAIAPTRELALQVKEELSWLYRETGAQTTSCVGGMDPRAERRNLDRGVHIVVGTPGRLRDHLERGALDLSELKAVVLDEADEMLDMGFREDLEFILGSAPEGRRTLMFSATVSKPIAQLAERFQRNAVRLTTINAREQHIDIDYVAHPVAPHERENAIINVLRLHEAEKSILFCSTREAVKRLTSRLANRGFAIVSLSGELSQAERSNALAAMKDGRARVCVATDVAARGIDLPNLDLVIHADLPTGKEGLLHRSGRTGRAGRKGTCVLMVPFPRRRQAERILQWAGIKVTWAGAPTADDIRAKDKARLMSDPVFTAETDEDTVEIARELLENHDAESIAAAFVKLHQSRMPAPEEITAANADSLAGRGTGERGGRVAEIRGKFDSGAWYKLSLGHKHRADPKWLLPMICKAGGVTKKDVGAIKIYQNETHVEIDGAVADSYTAAVLENGTGERNVSIDPIDLKGAKTPTAPEEARSGGFRDRKGGPGGGGGRFERNKRGFDYEGSGREDRLDGDRPSRGPARGPGAPKPAPRARKRRFGDDEETPNHPAYAPLDMKELGGGADRKGKKPSGPKGAVKPAGAKKKAAKPGKPSRADRKESKAAK